MSGDRTSRAVSQFDIVVRDALVVGEETKEIADIAISDGRIAQLGGTPKGKYEIRAEGMIVTPGGIDMHVHFTPMPGANSRPDDFRSGSLAAANGGITTVGNMTHQRPGEGLMAALDRETAVASSQSIVDFVLHPVLNNPTKEAINEIGELRTAGHGTVKIFMVFPNFETSFPAYEAAMAMAASVDVRVLIHCEDPGVIDAQLERLSQQGLLGPENYGRSRPVQSELVAVERALQLAETTGAAIHIVHLASADALALCTKARKRGVRVTVETRPLYLHLTENVFERPDAVLYTGNPPPRSESDRAALWRGLASGDVDAIASDHAPWNRAEKSAAGIDIRSALPGLPELDTMLPMIFSEGVTKGRLSLGQFVRVTAKRPAELLGLAPSKGAISVGADADLVVWDPRRKWTVRTELLATRTDYSPYEGWELEGAPIFTMVRGVLVRTPDGPVAGSQKGRLAVANRSSPSNRTKNSI